MARNFFLNKSSSLEPVGPLCGKPKPENYESMSPKEKMDYYFGEESGSPVTKEELESRRVATPESIKEWMDTLKK